MIAIECVHMSASATVGNRVPLYLPKMDFKQFTSAFPTNKCTIGSQLPVFYHVTRTFPSSTRNTKIFSRFEVEPFISVGKIIACCGACLKRWWYFVSLAAWYCMYFERRLQRQTDGFGKWGGMRKERERVLWDNCTWQMLPKTTWNTRTLALYISDIFSLLKTLLLRNPALGSLLPHYV